MSKVESRSASNCRRNGVNPAISAKGKTPDKTEHLLLLSWLRRSQKALFFKPRFTYQRYASVWLIAVLSSLSVCVGLIQFLANTEIRKVCAEGCRMNQSSRSDKVLRASSSVVARGSQ